MSTSSISSWFNNSLGNNWSNYRNNYGYQSGNTWLNYGNNGYSQENNWSTWGNNSSGNNWPNWSNYGSSSQGNSMESMLMSLIGNLFGLNHVSNSGSSSNPWNQFFDNNTNTATSTVTQPTINTTGQYMTKNADGTFNILGGLNNAKSEMQKTSTNGTLVGSNNISIAQAQSILGSGAKCADINHTGTINPEEIEAANMFMDALGTGGSPTGSTTSSEVTQFENLSKNDPNFVTNKISQYVNLIHHKEYNANNIPPVHPDFTSGSAGSGILNPTFFDMPNGIGA